MATVIERFKQGGITLKFEGGKLKVFVDVPKVTAASEFDPIGKVAIYELDRDEVDEIGRAIKSEGGRFWKRIKRALGIR